MSSQLHCIALFVTSAAMELNSVESSFALQHCICYTVLELNICAMSSQLHCIALLVTSSCDGAELYSELSCTALPFALCLSSMCSELSIALSSSDLLAAAMELTLLY